MKVIVTGTNKGLGLCLVKKFAQMGHSVVAGFYEKDDISKLQEFVNSKNYNGEVFLVPMDVSDEKSVSQAVSIIKEKYSQIDAVIHNAAVLFPSDRNSDILNTDIDILRKTLEVNTIGTVIVMKHIYDIVRKDGKGIMIFITSDAASITNTGSSFPAYSISKAAANKAVIILKRTIGDACRIYAMHPGWMKTDMGGEGAQIDPMESAQGIYDIIVGNVKIDKDVWYINYKGEQMIV
ncbi:SDR family NAD(P)-dependent oxidoreductase [Anaerocellum danielii]|uniref:SDR family NAD(P)-dependent oxidoreductase n=1 Tax=Anaerocellum danielii TaxID=1387557 RepID=A0ABZ0TZ16_9FIRM|nr:SDR family NAD(P)-dependent oxidoreductase [Caldicellulosiruptor danielii]WPX08467.1 SDR family NAD(P)-dependent oxidoreductase [Caldicellulosiruptor danielii]